MATPSPATDPSTKDNMRYWLTFGIALAGILATIALVVFIVQVFHNQGNPAQTIVAVMSPAIGAVTTLVGFVAGHAAGAAGGQQMVAASQQQTSSAQRKLDAVLDVSDPGVLGRAKAAHGEAFQ